MRRIESLINEYGESHQNKTNILIHGIAVPSIYFVTFALVWSVPFPQLIESVHITWAHIAAVPVLFYYFKLSNPIGVAMSLLTVLVFIGISILVSLNISVWKFSLVLFIIMWIFQFVGHHIEGKKPSFLKDIQFLLVGPAWWWVHWLKRLNIQY